jgi:AcrR family transcriptional regulator
MATPNHSRRRRKEPRQSRGRTTVDIILKATARVLLEDGYDAFTTKRVAQVAGVSIGSLYQYFPNKQALLVALVENHQQTRVEQLGRMISELAPLEEAIPRYIEAMIETQRLGMTVSSSSLSCVLRFRNVKCRSS